MSILSFAINLESAVAMYFYIHVSEQGRHVTQKKKEFNVAKNIAVLHMVDLL